MSLPTKYPHVFRPLTIGSMTLKNRVQFSLIVSGHAETVTGASNNDLVEFLCAQARSGASPISTRSRRSSPPAKPTW